MSQLRSKIAAGLTIVALGGLAGLALSHPQAPPPTKVQSTAAAVNHAAPHAAFADDEGGGADD